MQSYRNLAYPSVWALAIVLALPSIASLTAQENQVSQSQIRSVTVGRLIRAGRTQHGKPQFALLDDGGNISSHVVPVAGLSLAKYVNQRVKVTARSATRGRDNLPYILAQRVTVLGDATSSDSSSNNHRRMNRGVVKTNRSSTNPITMPKNDIPDLFADLELEPVDATDDTDAIDMPEIVAPPAEIAAVEIDRFDHLEIDDDVEVETVGAAVLADEELLPKSAIVEDDLAGQPSILARDGIANDHSYYEGYDCPGCAQCGYGGATNCLPPDSCRVGPIGRYWFRGEYLLWWTKGIDLPALVTSSPSNTPANQAGVIDQNGTVVLFGNESVLEDSRNGARFRLGKWLDYCQWLGVEAEYFFISEEDAGFTQTSTGGPILARPFFNTNLNQQDSELVAYPSIVSGAIDARVTSSLHSFAPRIRTNLCAMNFSCDPANACAHPNGCGGVMCGRQGGQRLDFILGYRYINLDESLTVRENLATTQNGVPTGFVLNDMFETENHFHGAELGFLWERYRGNWSLELLGKVALGNNHQIVTINGNTDSSANGISFSDPGGILALSSNIGRYSDDSFVAIPEFGVTVGYLIAPDLRFSVGYTFFYWSDMVRPGDQIDLNVNPDLIPPIQATTGSQSPAFTFIESDYWAQGLSLGLDYRW